jgi:hypothetical protein
MCRDFDLEGTDLLAKHKVLRIDYARKRRQHLVANGPVLSFEIKQWNRSLFCRGKTHAFLS